MADVTSPLPLDPTRRRFLLAGAGALALAACGGGDGDDGATGSTADDPASSEGGGLSIVRFFDGAALVAGGEVRAPIGLADVDGLLGGDRTPAELEVLVLRDGDELATVSVARHDEGLPRPYYPLRFDAPEPGVHDLRIVGGDFDGAEASFELPDPSEVAIPGPGDPFPRVDTPTVDDPRGVTPICTREPECPLHDQNLPALLDSPRPTVVLISTPAFCSTAVCGPVLELVLAERASSGDAVDFLHAEVYADPETDLGRVAPVVEAMRLTFEPSVVFVDADGTIRERLDFVFDTAELSSAMARLVG